MAVAASPEEVSGPAWSDRSFQNKAGRFPLAVEAHVLNMTARLLPGVTTVTTNVRYLSLHGLTLAEAERRSLGNDELLDLSRRCEVVFALAAANNGQGIVSNPHGIDKLQSLISESGPWDLGQLSNPGSQGFSDARGGFRGPYVGSEITLGVREREQIDMPGPRFDSDAASLGLVGLLDAANQTTLRPQDLDELRNLTLDPAGQQDERWLRSLLLGEVGSDDDFYRQPDRARRTTVELLVRAVEAEPSSSFNDSFINFIVYGSESARLGEHAYAWQGTILRSFCVGAWRRLWSWLVEAIDGFTPVDAIGDALASELPDTTVGSWVSSLPSSVSDGQALPAETIVSTEMGRAAGCVATLFVGAARLEELDGSARRAFVGRSTVLGPEWVQARIEDWHGRPLRDFAHSLVGELFRRSQRIAQKKAYLDRETGRIVVPTRVHVDEGLAWKDSSEGAGDVGLRVSQLGGMLASLGVFEQVDGAWVATDKARGLDD